MFCKFLEKSEGKAKYSGMGWGGGSEFYNLHPFFRKNFETNIAHNYLLCAYNLYVEFHCNWIIITECCFRGSLNMGPVDPQNGS